MRESLFTLNQYSVIFDSINTEIIYATQMYNNISFEYITILKVDLDNILSNTVALYTKYIH